MTNTPEVIVVSFVYTYAIHVLNSRTDRATSVTQDGYYCTIEGGWCLDVYIYIYTWVAVLIDPALLRLLITRHKNPRPLPSRPTQHTLSILSIAISSQLLFLQLTSISYYRNRFRPLPANIWFRGSHNFMKSETRIQKSTVFFVGIIMMRAYIPNGTSILVGLRRWMPIGSQRPSVFVI